MKDLCFIILGPVVFLFTLVTLFCFLLFLDLLEFLAGVSCGFLHLLHSLGGEEGGLECVFFVVFIGHVAPCCTLTSGTFLTHTHTKKKYIHTNNTYVTSDDPCRRMTVTCTRATRRVWRTPLSRIPNNPRRRTRSPDGLGQAWQVEVACPEREHSSEGRMDGL